MIATAKVSQRGQVAIPKEFRDDYHINQGDTLYFEKRPDGFFVRTVPDFLSLQGSLPSIPVTIEQAIEESTEAELNQCSK
jgi:AbrB family looped-hinge helix DNA binding protein